ncbi:MAG: Arc family DNA-binding protein [Ruminococcus sp.]|nr:Arc family DNA-binding protein [Ruminococcus sp.]
MDIINFNLRLPEDINDKITEIAKKEGRSKNKEIEYILRQYIEEYKKKNP